MLAFLATYINCTLLEAVTDAGFGVTKINRFTLEICQQPSKTWIFHKEQ